MRSAAALGAVVLAALVSGCSAGDAAPAEVGPLASGSSGASLAATPSPSTSAIAPDGTGPTPPLADLPRLPDAARSADAKGASAFARYYVATMGTALATSDVDQLKALSHPLCGGCSNVIIAITRAAEAGHHVRGAALVVDFAEAPALTDDETIVDLRYQRQAGEVVAADGSVVSTIAPEGPLDTQLRVRRVDGGWSVLGFRQTPR